MEHRDEIGFQVRMLSHLIERTVNQAAFSNQDTPVTGMQGWIMGYLYENRERDVFQRDLQAHFSVRRSTVTGILQLMEKNGLITRRSVDWDARLKKLELTPKALEMHEHVISSIKQTERTLSSSLSEEEKGTFIRLCDKIKAGIQAACPESRKA